VGTQYYYGTKRILATPHEQDGKPGYDVTYEDGYKSWSPKEVFEKVYQLSTAMSFGHAIVAMQAGEPVCRRGWNGRGMYLEIQTPDEHSKMDLPYIYMKTVDGKLVPWLASQTDMLANDWMVL